MEPKSKSPAWMLGILGGALLVIGSILPWLKVSIDLDRFAAVLGIDPSLLQDSGAPASESVGGLDADGMWTLIAGIVVLVCAGLLVKRANKSLGVVLALGGLVGAGITLYDIMSKDRQLDEGLASAGAELQELGLNAETFKEVFSVSFSIGIYVCLVGGIVALIAGALALRAGPEPIAATASGTSAPGAGLGGTPGPAAPAGPTTPIAAPPPASSPIPPVPPATPQDPPAPAP